MDNYQLESLTVSGNMDFNPISNPPTLCDSNFTSPPDDACSADVFNSLLFPQMDFNIDPEKFDQFLLHPPRNFDSSPILADDVSSSLPQDERDSNDCKIVSSEMMEHEQHSATKKLALISNPEYHGSVLENFDQKSSDVLRSLRFTVKKVKSGRADGKDVLGVVEQYAQLCKERTKSEKYQQQFDQLYGTNVSKGKRGKIQRNINAKASAEKRNSLNDGLTQAVKLLVNELRPRAPKTSSSDRRSARIAWERSAMGDMMLLNKRSRSIQAMSAADSSYVRHGKRNQSSLEAWEKLSTPTNSGLPKCTIDISTSTSTWNSTSVKTSIYSSIISRIRGILKRTELRPRHSAHRCESVPIVRQSPEKPVDGTKSIRPHTGSIHDVPFSSQPQITFSQALTCSVASNDVHLSSNTLAKPNEETSGRLPDSENDTPTSTLSSTSTRRSIVSRVCGGFFRKRKVGVEKGNVAPVK